MAQRAHAFGMALLAYDPFVGHERARRIGVELTDDLDRIYAIADVITIHLPKTRDTEGLIDKEALEQDPRRGAHHQHLARRDHR